MRRASCRRHGARQGHEDKLAIGLRACEALECESDRFSSRPRWTTPPRQAPRYHTTLSQRVHGAEFDGGAPGLQKAAKALAAAFPPMIFRTVHCTIFPMRI